MLMPIKSPRSKGSGTEILRREKKGERGEGFLSVLRSLEEPA